MSLPAEVLVHTVTVTPKEGTSSTGPVYGAAFPLDCMAQGGHRLVRDSDGQERVASLTVYAPSPTDAARIPAGSLVDWRGQTTTVLQSTPHDTGGLAPEGEHTEVVCE